MPVGVTSDGHGNLLVVGGGYDNSGYHSIVRQSSDGGDTWSTVGDYQSSPTAVAADAAGGLWVVGQDLTLGWLVRHSGDAGVSWADSDHYRLDPSASSLARSVAVDMAGNVFVAGQSRATTNGVSARFWIVRKLAGPPQLSLAPANGQLRLVWPTNAAGFVLQSATTLTNGGDWQDSLLSATESNGQKVVTLSPTGACGFFRLRGP